MARRIFPAFESFFHQEQVAQSRFDGRCFVGIPSCGGKLYQPALHQSARPLAELSLSLRDPFLLRAVVGFSPMSRLVEHRALRVGMVIRRSGRV